MPYIFGKLWHLAIIWAIRKAFQCILQGVRFLLANHTRLSPTSNNDSYSCWPCIQFLPTTISPVNMSWRYSFAVWMLTFMKTIHLFDDWQVGSVVQFGIVLFWFNHITEKGKGQKVPAFVSKRYFLSWIWFLRRCRLSSFLVPRRALLPL